MGDTFDDSKNPYRPDTPLFPAGQPSPSGEPSSVEVAVQSPLHAGKPTATAAGLGDHLNRAFSAYMAQWSQWPVPMLVAGLIVLASYCLCCMSLLVVGPLSCGLYACAFRGLRGEPIEVGALGRGWERLGTSMLAGIVLTVLQLAPLLLVYLVFFLSMGAMGALLNAAPGGGVRPGGAPGGGPGGGNDAAALLIVLPMIVVMMLMMLAFYAWTLWFSTRTMFVMPLIADRGTSFTAALATSWEATRKKVWELMLLQFLAGLIASIGIQICYVGAIFTFPLYYLCIAAAYDARLGIQSRG